ncbi:SRPBCC family protein [Cupriavidus necator]|uniref:SRPBCC family protein n=1 Tax=Cupriavidus necator TaxID=106590 RepID=UPI00339D8A1E
MPNPACLTLPARACAALLLAIGIAAPAQAQMIAVERSVEVQADPVRVWQQAGNYCGLPKWDTAYKDCSVVLGDGGPGTVRRMARKAGGLPAVDVLTDKGPYSYSYRKLSNHTRGRLQVTAGNGVGTTRVTWQLWLDPSSVPNGAQAEYPAALAEDMQISLERLKAQAEAAQREAEAAAARGPASTPSRAAPTPAEPSPLGA